MQAFELTWNQYKALENVVGFESELATDLMEDNGHSAESVDFFRITLDRGHMGYFTEDCQIVYVLNGGGQCGPYNFRFDEPRQFIRLEKILQLLVAYNPDEDGFISGYEVADLSRNELWLLDANYENPVYAGEMGSSWVTEGTEKITLDLPDEVGGSNRNVETHSYTLDRDLIFNDLLQKINNQ